MPQFPHLYLWGEGLDHLVVLSGSMRPGMCDLARTLDLSTEMAEVHKLWLTPRENNRATKSHVLLTKFRAKCLMYISSFNSWGRW